MSIPKYLAFAPTPSAQSGHGVDPIQSVTDYGLGLGMSRHLAEVAPVGIQPILRRWRVVEGLYLHLETLHIHMNLVVTDGHGLKNGAFRIALLPLRGGGGGGRD